MFVKNRYTAIIITLMATNSLHPVAEAKPINSVELSPHLRVVIARQKAQANQNIKADDYIKLDDKRDDMFDESVGECGNVNIGNVHNDSPFGPKKPNITVVTGDVVNLGGDDC